MGRRSVVFFASLLWAAAGCSSEPPPPGEKVSVFKMAVGNCYNDVSVEVDDGEPVSEIRLTDCGQPHKYEVYHIHRMTDARFPGDEVVEEVADEVCEKHFKDFVGVEYDDSVYFLDYYYPTRSGWKTEKDRDIVCMITDEDGEPIIGSVKGIGK